MSPPPTKKLSRKESKTVVKEGYFVCGSEDNRVYIFSYPVDHKPALGVGESRRLTSLPGHEAPVLDVSWNCDGTILVSCDSTGVVKVWNKL